MNAKTKESDAKTGFGSEVIAKGTPNSMLMRFRSPQPMTQLNQIQQRVSTNLVGFHEDIDPQT